MYTCEELDYRRFSNNFPSLLKRNKKNFNEKGILLDEEKMIINYDFFSLKVRNSFWMLQTLRFQFDDFLKKMTFQKLSIHTTKKKCCTRKHRTLIIETSSQLINVNQ